MKKALVTAAIAVMAITSAQSAFAFTDTTNDPNASKIEQLQKLGVVNGSQNGQFLPKENMTTAAGITLIVKALELDFGDIVFVKAPQASDYFTTISDKAWYAQAFMLAGVNQLGLPRDVNPSAPLTREQFAHYLFKAMTAKADLAFIEIYQDYKDANEVTSGYADSIQKMLLTKVIKLDENQKFNPKQTITRSEAAAWTYDTIQYLKDHATAAPDDGGEQQPSPLYDAALTTKAVNEQVNEVTITAQVPNPGYGIKIDSIVFDGNQAVIHVSPTYPKEDMMYPQVITDVKITTYIASGYKPVLAAGATTSSSAGAGVSDSTVSTQ